MGRLIRSVFLAGLALLFIVLACARPDRPSIMAGSGASGPAVDGSVLRHLTEGDETYPHIPRMTIEDLAAHMGDPDTMVIDARPQDQWLISERKILGAIHQNPETVESWAGAFPKGKTLVIYCA